MGTSVENGLAMARQWEEMRKQEAYEARQQREDEWNAKQRARTQKDWEQQDRVNAIGDTEYQNYLNRQPETELDVGQSFGIQRTPATAAPSMGYATGGMGMDPAQAGQANLEAMAPPKARKVSDGRQALQSLAKIAGASRDWNAFYKARAEDDKLRIGEESAQIADYITNLSPAERAAYAEKVTSDKRNKYEAVVDPKTGYTTIKLGDKTANLSPTQLGQWFAAKHRLKNGDYSAIAEMEGIDKNLAEQVKSELGALKDVGTVNNQAATGMSTDRYHTESNRIQALDVANRGVYYGKLGNAAEAKAAAAQTKAQSAYERMPESHRLAVTQAFSAASSAQKSLEALESKLAESGVPPTPEQTRALTNARLKAQQASIGHKRAQYRTGMLDEEDIASEILVSAENANEVTQSIKDAQKIYGVDPAKLNSAIQGNPMYERLFKPQQPTGAPTAPANPVKAELAAKPAPAAGMAPPANTPVVKPKYYTGIEQVSASRGKPAGWEWNGKVYPTEEDALRAQQAMKK